MTDPEVITMQALVPCTALPKMQQRVTEMVYHAVARTGAGAIQVCAERQGNRYLFQAVGLLWPETKAEMAKRDALIAQMSEHMR